MSDSGFSGLPPGPRTGDVPLPQDLFELKAKIIELRAELKASRVRQKLEGEIVRHNKDGSTVIRTPKGEVTVELRGRDKPPPGTKVEIELPPGNPPRQAVVRPAPEQTAARPAEPPPPETEQAAPPQDNRTAKAPPGERPRLDIRTAEDLARHIERLPPEQRAPVTVKPGDIIRLLPLAPEQLQDIIRPAATPATPAQLTRLPAQPQITVENALFENISPLLTLSRAAHARLSSDLPVPLPLLTQQTAAPLPQNRLNALPVIARTPVQQLLQYILQANQPAVPTGASRPFEIIAPPVLIAPASVLTPAGPEQTLLSLPAAHQAPALGLITPQQSDAATFMQTTIADTQKPSFPASSQNNFFDIRIQALRPPNVKLVDAMTQTRTMPTLAALRQNAPLSQMGPAGSLTGEITGITQQNLPVLSFYLPGFETPQNFVMQFQAANLPPGTQIQGLPQTGKQAGLPQQTALAPFIPFEFFSSFSWPAMQELNQTLQQAAPQAAQVLANVTASPAAPTRLPMAALFFIAAIRSGDISGWLGDKTVDTLRRLGKADLLSRLGRDASGLQRTAAEPAGEWRATALPMMWDGEMHKMMLYYRHDEDHDPDSEDGKRGTRFIFDLNLSRMGDVQLDGLHRPGKLDLIVRTTDKLSAPMQKHMRRLYISALEQTALSGELSFQNKAAQFVKVEMPKKAVNNG